MQGRSGSHAHALPVHSYLQRPEQGVSQGLGQGVWYEVHAGAVAGQLVQGHLGEARHEVEWGIQNGGTWVQT